MLATGYGGSVTFERPEWGMLTPPRRKAQRSTGVRSTLRTNPIRYILLRPSPPGHPADRGWIWNESIWQGPQKRKKISLQYQCLCPRKNANPKAIGPHWPETQGICLQNVVYFLPWLCDAVDPKCVYVHSHNAQHVDADQLPPNGYVYGMWQWWEFHAVTRRSLLGWRYGYRSPDGPSMRRTTGTWCSGANAMREYNRTLLRCRLRHTFGRVARAGLAELWVHDNTTETIITSAIPRLV